MRKVVFYLTFTLLFVEITIMLGSTIMAVVSVLTMFLILADVIHGHVKLKRLGIKI